MRTAKFNVHVCGLTEFLNYINSQGLKSTIVSKKDDVYNIEITYTREQAPIIAEMEELVDVLIVLASAFTAVLTYLAAAFQKRGTNKPAPSKTVNKKHCFFNDFIAQNVKK
jgi:hypothetical protein